jgi:hypothetical protein
VRPKLLDDHLTGTQQPFRIHASDASGRHGSRADEASSRPGSSRREEAPRKLWLAPPPSRGSPSHRCRDPSPGRLQPRRARNLATPHVTAGFVAEAPTRSARPLDRERNSKPEGPHSRPRLKGRCVSTPAEAKASDAPRTRMVHRFPDPPGSVVSDPSVVRTADHVRRRPARPLSRPCHRSLGDRCKAKRRAGDPESDLVAIFSRRSMSFRDQGRWLGTLETLPRDRLEPGKPSGRGKPRESIGRSLNPLGAPCRSHSNPKAGLFPATKGTSRSLQSASGSPPWQ